MSPPLRYRPGAFGLGANARTNSSDLPAIVWLSALEAAFIVSTTHFLFSSITNKNSLSGNDVANTATSCAIGSQLRVTASSG